MLDSCEAWDQKPIGPLALNQLLTLRESMEGDATLLCTLTSTDNRNNHGTR